MMARYSSSILWLMVTCLVLAQAQTATAKTPVSLHFDRPLYSLGDVMRYAVLADADLLQHHVVLEALLVAPDGRVVRRGFAQVDRAGGLLAQLELPYDLEPAVYRLRIEALQVDRQSPRLLVEGLVPIYNDLDAATWPSSSDDQSFREATQRAGALAPVERSGQVSQLSLKPVGGLRDELQFELPNAAVPALMHSLDVGLYPMDWPVVYVQQAVTVQLDTSIWISGLWADEAGQPVSSNLLAALSAERKRFAFTKSDAQGQFLLRLPAFTGSQDFQFGEQNLPVRAATRDDRRDEFRIELPGHEQLADCLKASAQRRRVYSTYGRESAFAKTVHTPVTVSAPEADLAYGVGDYTTLPDFATFAFELFGTASRWRPRKESYYVRVYNRKRKEYFKQEPLIIVDGYLTRDINGVSALQPSDLDSVFIYGHTDRLRAAYPALGQSGVIRITTRQGADVREFRNPQVTLRVHGLTAAAYSIDQTNLPWLLPAPVFELVNDVSSTQAAVRHSDDRSSFVLTASRTTDADGLQRWRSDYTVE